MNIFLLLAVLLALLVAFANGLALYIRGGENPGSGVLRETGKWTCILTVLCALVMVLSISA